MKRSRFSEEQIIGVLKEHEAGTKTADLCRKHGINETLFTSLAQARAALEEWRRDYNTVRPHSRIGWLTPAAYAEQLSMQRGQGAALSAGSAPWPLNTDQTEKFNRQTLLSSAPQSRVTTFGVRVTLLSKKRLQIRCCYYGCVWPDLFGPGAAYGTQDAVASNATAPSSDKIFEDYFFCSPL